MKISLISEGVKKKYGILSIQNVEMDFKTMADLKKIVDFLYLKWYFSIFDGMWGF